MSSYQLLLARVRLVRSRWRMQMLAKGASLFLACGIVLLILSVWGAGFFGFRAAAIWFTRIVAAAGIVYAAVHFLYQPLRRRVTEVQIAQYVEEQFPELQDRLVSAVEFGRGASDSSGMLDLLIRDALDKTNRVDFSVFRRSRRIAAFGSLGTAACVSLLLLLAWGPGVFRYGFDRLYMPWTEAAGDAGRLIAVTPGDVELGKGSDQLIKADLVGFDSREVKLYTSTRAGGAWTPVPMEPQARGSSFVYLMIEIQSSLRYYVEAQGTRSATYNLTVTDLARVEKIGLRYTFPAYTGMPQQTVDNEGDISALKGTRVDLNVHLNQGAKGVRLLFDDKSTLPLAPSGNLDFAGGFTLTRSGSYVVQVESGDGKNLAASPEYEMEAQEDALPRITVAKPQRDLRATSVEEVFTELKADDDIGVGRVELHYSVNGDKEKTLRLYGAQGRQPSVTAVHTFFLEEFGLQPGDVVSYYGKAYDDNVVSGPGTSSSDIYFIQVRPFEQKYTQSQQGGQPGAGEGGQNELSRRQKEIISATFKLIRDRERMEPKEYGEGLKALSLVQNRLQLQAQGLADRMKRRGVVGVNEDFAKLAEYLEAATRDMGAASVKLGAQKPSDALPDEQKALQQLMRAESLFREIQVAFSAGGGGGGSDSQASAEELADLFELEMDKLKNQYETVQRGEQQARDEKIDEAMQRLKELAQRQQQLNERNRNMAMRGGSPAGGSAGAGQSQQQLIQEAEQLQRQLQRLSRERSSPELNRVSDRLQQSIQEMKRALEQSQRKSPQEADARGSRALQQLEDARRALARGQLAGLSQGLDQAVEESRQALEEQSRIRDGVAKLAQDKAQAPAQALQQKRSDLIERKSLLSERVRNLGKKIDDLSKATRNTQRETSSRLNDASAAIRDKGLPERILGGNQMLQGGYYDYLKGREDYIRSGLEEVQKQLEAARSSLGQTHEGKLDEAVNRTRQLAEGLESMQRRMQGGQAAQGADRKSAGRPGEQAGQANGRRNAGTEQGQSGARRGGNPTPYGAALSLGSSGPPTGAGDDERRQFRREAQERLADAQELRRMLERGSGQIPNVDKLIESLRGVEGSAARQAELIARLRAALDLLHTIDRDLSRELAQINQKDRYLTSEDSEAPSAYKQLVEEYYRALAKSKP